MEDAYWRALEARQQMVANAKRSSKRTATAEAAQKLAELSAWITTETSERASQIQAALPMDRDAPLSASLVLL